MKFQKRDFLLFILIILTGVLAMLIFCRPSDCIEAREPDKVIAVEIVDVAEIEKIDNIYTFEVTAYCPCELCCGEWADGITYTGTIATEGRTIAVDPNVIPLGTTVTIDGEDYIAEDIGGAVQGNHIDMFFDSHNDAINFGRQYLEIHIEEAQNEKM